MVGIHLPEKGEEGLVTENELPVGLNGLHLLQVVHDQGVVLGFEDHPLLGVQVEQAVEILVIVHLVPCGLALVSGLGQVRLAKRCNVNNSCAARYSLEVFQEMPHHSGVLVVLVHLQDSHGVLLLVDSVF